MPINRGDKHWCAPERETPPESGEWTCPECKTVWLFTPADGADAGGVWERPEDRDHRLEQQAHTAELEALESEGDEQ